MPYTGPIVETFVSDPQGIYRLKRRYRSLSRPYKEPLPYFTGFYFGGRVYNTDPEQTVNQGKVIGGASLSIAQGDLSYLCVDQAYAKAYNRFVKQMKDTASIGVGLVEAKSSYQMIYRRSTQFLGLLSALRKKDFEAFQHHLGVTTVAGRRRTRLVWSRQAKSPATPANLLLEYQFGWKPMVQDVGAAVKVLQSEFDPIPRVSSGTASDSWRTNENGTGGFVYQRSSLSVSAKVRMGALVVPSNPNLALANQLGFVNPAAVAWQTLPASFLFDWFVPVGRFLESYTDFVGFSIQRGWVSHSLRSERSYDVAYMGSDPVYPVRAGNSDKAIGFTREPKTSFSIPTLRSQVKLPGGDLLGKATSTVAMLIQQLSNRKK